MESKSNNFTSVKYHQIFDFKLTKEEAFKWQYKKEKPSIVSITSKKSGKRLQKEKYSQAKLKIAKKAANLISKIPTVKFVGITGSLAMMNANKNSDIDLMIITTAGCLWTTRLLVYGMLRVTGYELRKPKQTNEKNKLCINLWLDENDLIWNKNDRNIYTAHEIAQIAPLVNKDKIYERFLNVNRWILTFWPNSVRIRGYKEKVMSPDSSFLSSILLILERIVFKLQYWYMSRKITREVITSTRALFHPNNWGEVVMSKLG